ncbi:MAG: hypothetical protein ABR608_14255 [Pseudonocardiaceae bacterium]
MKPFYRTHERVIRNRWSDVWASGPFCSEDEVAWSYAKVGDSVAADGRLCVLLFGSRVAPVTSEETCAALDKVLDHRDPPRDA